MAGIDIKNAQCIIDACLCNYCGFDPNPATCMGCAYEGRCLCCTESCCFKTPCKPYTTCTLCHWCCFCYECECFKFEGMTLCQFEQQCLCLTSACAFPCTKEVPMMCTCLPCCLVYPSFGCCKNPYSGKVAPAAGAPEVECVGAPPDAMEMER